MIKSYDIFIYIINSFNVHKLEMKIVKSDTIFTVYKPFTINSYYHVVRCCPYTYNLTPIEQLKLK